MNTFQKSMKIRFDILLFVVLWSVVFHGTATADDIHTYGPMYQRHAIPKKIIALGWDGPDTAFVRDHRSEMEQNPLDGTAIVVRGQTGDAKLDEKCNTRLLWMKWRWQRDWFDQAREDLIATKFDRFDCNFIRVNVTPGNIDWFDDQGWDAVANNLALMAELAKASNLKGFVFDPESYRGQQFAYPVDAERAFSEYVQVARRRGRQMMEAIVDQYPEITILGLRFLSYEMGVVSARNPTEVLETEPYGLYPAFFNGMLDALPPEATLVEGMESTYLTNSTQEFLRFYNEMRVQALALVAPENHQKYRSQVQMGVAIYLDAYTNPRGVRWRVDDLGRPVIERLRQNLTNALAVTDEYVWLWGEKSHWFETASTEWHAERQNGKTWQQALPGIERAFRWARNPMQAAADDLPSLKSSDRLRNVVRNGSFEHAATRAPENAASDWGYEKMPDSWSSWQKDYSHGTMEWDPPAGRSGRGAVKAVGVTHGCFIQTIEVKPGQQYIIEAYSRAAGQAKPLLKVRWRGKTGDWISTYHDVSALFDSQSDDEQGEWLRSVTILTVPERAKQMVVLLYSFGGESDADIVWFSDIGAYELTPEVLW